MKVLLDTHTFIWWDSDPNKLSSQVLAILVNPATDVRVSVVSLWEIVIKTQVGKLLLKAPLSTIVGQHQAKGVQLLTATVDHVFALQGLPLIHKDPFDRLLVAQANVEGAVLVTADPVFAQYPVNVLW